MIEDPRTWSTSAANAVERSIVSRLLALANPARVLDLGTGTGRLIGTLTDFSREVVAVDSERRYLQAAVRTIPFDGRVQFLQGDGHALPLRSGSVWVAVAIRVIHRTSEPKSLLNEVHRVLSKPGHLIISYSPHPSPKTLEYDVRSQIGGTRSGRGLTFDRRPFAVVPSGDGLGHTATVTAMEQMLRATRFESEELVGAGFEDLALLKRLPVRVFQGLASGLTPTRLFSTKVGRYRAV
ncbi:MAG: class I SAM-dependent methyltransferase [Thermoplasmata archaeon]|nr:class I SAM-dependent methyltransferase [Thermoplasmata archaeon]